MAAPQFDPPLPGASFFDIYSDGPQAPAAPQVSPRNPISLPVGGCNFVDLSPGANRAKCGCRHFWPRLAADGAYADNAGPDNSAWCMCSHHACFHDFEREKGGSTPTLQNDPAPGHVSGYVPGQENERPRSIREPLSPVVPDVMSVRPAAEFPGSANLMNLDMDAVFAVPHPSRPTEEVNHPRSSGQPSQQPESTLQDTLTWGDYVQSHSGNTTLPPIPRQCLMPSSQPSSTTSSSQARYLRPFNGRGLATLSSVPQAPRSPLQEKPQDDPSPHGNVAELDPGKLASAVVPRPQSGGSTPKADQPSVPEDRLTSTIFGPPSRRTFQHLSEAVTGHEQRLDRLENVSFSASAHDECHEKHDATDLRVTDLEVRVEEVERLMNDASSQGTARRVVRHDNDDDTNSVVSGSTNATSRAVDHQEVYGHIQSLQSQLTQLRSYLPSYMHPWEAEVVFLPFPLRRIWQEANDFKTEPAANMDEWTQMPSTNGAPYVRAHSPFSGDWAEPGQDYSWLLPKAWGAQRLIDKRLRSRGLVRTISVKSPDARGVQAAMQAAFGTTLSDLALATAPASRRHHSTDSKVSRFLGLQNSWVPLRKMHKDSRLRFLSPAEMVTSALWDVSFLNSVVMHAAQPRLFVTQPEAYLQDLPAYDSGWTWQKIREMSRVYPDSQGTHEVREADALEDYWAWNEQLDEPASTLSSQSLPQARQRVSMSPSQQHFTLRSSLRSVSPYVPRGQTPMTDRQPSRPLRVRTTSMPPDASAAISSAGVKPRVASYGQQRTGGLISPHVTSRSSPISTAAAAARFKRQRTRSPGRRRNTPRGTNSPSPGLAAFPTDDRAGTSARGVTPLYYATPFSNAPGTEPRSRGPAAATDDRLSDKDYDDRLDDSDGAGSSTNIHEDASDASVEIVPPQVVRQAGNSHTRQPEDEPWPGIEDLDQFSDGENIDPLFSPADDGDTMSVTSSQPSEYPSTQRGWQGPVTEVDNGAGFHIHEDEQMPDSQ